MPVLLLHRAKSLTGALDVATGLPSIFEDHRLAVVQRHFLRHRRSAPRSGNSVASKAVNSSARCPLAVES
jgi:hypothetical protein